MVQIAFINDSAIVISFRLLEELVRLLTSSFAGQAVVKSCLRYPLIQFIRPRDCINSINASPDLVRVFLFTLEKPHKLSLLNGDHMETVDEGCILFSTYLAYSCWPLTSTFKIPCFFEAVD